MSMQSHVCRTFEQPVIRQMTLYRLLMPGNFLLLKHCCAKRRTHQHLPCSTLSLHICMHFVLRGLVNNVHMMCIRCPHGAMLGFGVLLEVNDLAARLPKAETHPRLTDIHDTCASPPLSLACVSKIASLTNLSTPRLQCPLQTLGLQRGRNVVYRRPTQRKGRR